MNPDEFDAIQRSREWFHGLRVPLGAWTIIRVDGRSFSRFTEANFDKPFDERFSKLMERTAVDLVSELGAIYGYTESDEISILFPPEFDLFNRSVEKLVSISAAIASSSFSIGFGRAVQFDSRIWIGTSVNDVVDYFSWRQADAARCALNGWCYWTLRKNLMSARAATNRLEGATTSDKNELLFGYGINFNDLPLWQRRGLGVAKMSYVKTGLNPISGETSEVTRRGIGVTRDLPMGDDYRQFIADVAEGEGVGVELALVS